MMLNKSVRLAQNKTIYDSDNVAFMYNGIVAVDIFERHCAKYNSAVEVQSRDTITVNGVAVHYQLTAKQ